MIPQLLEQLTALFADVRRSRAANVNSKQVKNTAIATGTFYFKQCRGDAAGILNNADQLAQFDQGWQRLIRLAHGNNAKASYLRLLKKLLRQLTELTVALHSLPAAKVNPATATISYSQAENILLSTLDQILPSAAASYKQGLNDLSSQNQRNSYRGPACEFREALRETLDLLAPDENVHKQPWYVQDPDTKGPTMKQKVRHILSSRGKTKNEQSVAEKSVDLIEALSAERSLVRSTIVRLSQLTSRQPSRRSHR